MWRRILKSFWISGWTKQGLGSKTSFDVTSNTSLYIWSTKHRLIKNKLYSSSGNCETNLLSLINLSLPNVGYYSRYGWLSAWHHRRAHTMQRALSSFRRSRSAHRTEHCRQQTRGGHVQVILFILISDMQVGGTSMEAAQAWVARAAHAGVIIGV